MCYLVFASGKQGFCGFLADINRFKLVKAGVSMIRINDSMIRLT